MLDFSNFKELVGKYSECIEELGLESKTYITINRGADSMGRSTMQTKVWPQEHYEEFVRLFNKTYPNFKVVQLGTISNAKIETSHQIQSYSRAMDFQRTT